MPLVSRQRAGATNTRSGGQVRPVQRVILMRAPTPVPMANVAKIVPMEEEADKNTRALQALRLQDGLNQVPINLFLKVK